MSPPAFERVGKTSPSENQQWYPTNSDTPLRNNHTEYEHQAIFIALFWSTGVLFSVPYQTREKKYYDLHFRNVTRSKPRSICNFLNTTIFLHHRQSVCVWLVITHHACIFWSLLYDITQNSRFVQ